jgi:hypothetical protein
MGRIASLIRPAGATCLGLLLAMGASAGTESNAPVPAASPPVSTNSPELLKLCLQLSEQLRATQLAVEQSRQETKEAAAQSEQALSKGLQAIQVAFAAQQARDSEAMQRSNRTVLTALGAFAAVGLLSILLMTYFQWRMSKGLARICAALPTALGLEAGAATAALGPGESAQLRLPGAIEQPEHRRAELALRSRRTAGRTLERRLFPRDSDAFRRRQFRAFKMALVVGVIFALVVALVIYLVYLQRNPA